jgi:hypothetical protein
VDRGRGRDVHLQDFSLRPQCISARPVAVLQLISSHMSLELLCVVNDCEVLMGNILQCDNVF